MAKVQQKDQAKKFKKWLSKKRVKEVEEYMSNKSVLDVLQDMVRKFFKSKDAPNTTSKCRKKLRGVFIHISDFVRGDLHMRKKNIHELEARVGQIGPFPKKKAKANPTLAVLLRYLSY